MKYSVFLGAALFACAAHADTVTIEAYELGGDVVFAGTGSVDTTLLGSSSDSSGSGTSRSQFNFFGDLEGDSTGFNPVVNPFTPLNSSSFLLSVTGDHFFVQSNGASTGFVDVPRGYVSGDPISFFWTTSGTTLGSLGLNYGTVATYPGNTVVLQEGMAPIPVPAGLPLALTGLLGLGAIARRKRRRAARDH